MRYRPFLLVLLMFCRRTCWLLAFHARNAWTLPAHMRDLCNAVAGPLRKGTVPYHVYRETLFRTLKTTKSLRMKEATWN